MKKQRHGYNLPDDCWELIFQKLREDDERDMYSISLVSKQFLLISNRVKLSLNVHDETLPLLPNLLQRFQLIKSIVINTYNHQDIDGVVHQISQSGFLNLLAIKFWCTSVPPRDGFKALALNKNIKNNLKVLDCSRLISMQDKDLVLIADSFPELEELRISVRDDMYDDDEVAARITDDGVDALASKLKELKKIVFQGNACFITDQSLISLSSNCVKLREISLLINGSAQHNLTEGGIDFVVRHSRNLTSLSLELQSLQPSAFSSTMENPFTHAKNLHSLTMTQKLFSDKRICLVAKAHPPLKKLNACQSTLEELTLGGLYLREAAITDFAPYLSNLTSIHLHDHALTSVTFYTLTKYCPLLEKLIMVHSRGQVMDTFSRGYSHKNYRMQYLDISGNMLLNDTALENFGQVCPNLRFLCVHKCLRLTNVGIGEILRRCPKITQLNINGLQVSNVFGRYSDDHSVLNLKTLEARMTEIDDKGMAMIGNRCRNLQYLDICYCNEVTNKGVMEVVTNCARLRDIDLIGCEKVSTYISPEMAFSRRSSFIHEVVTVLVNR
ncbi:F-box/LRR-repeat protein 4-like [Rhododendron vialii]|uniref:F-box/LRR-repeat protein 4-like n=1 Tax=Rhododendron vialii TaxID=182163 RepID=UPI0026603F72|nr:F-box/LRR-repeat protein 4-like [Rhododendron vialii]